MTLIAPNSFPLPFPPLLWKTSTATLWIAGEKPALKAMMKVPIIKGAGCCANPMIIYETLMTRRDTRAKLRSNTGEWSCLEACKGASSAGNWTAGAFVLKSLMPTGSQKVS